MATVAATIWSRCASARDRPTRLGNDRRRTARRAQAQEHRSALCAGRAFARRTVPFSAHATISKACHYLGLKLTRVPVGEDYRADVRAMEAAIGPDTIALAGSAQSWPYGKIDPI